MTCRKAGLQQCEWARCHGRSPFTDGFPSLRSMFRNDPYESIPRAEWAHLDKRDDILPHAKRDEKSA